MSVFNIYKGRNTDQKKDITLRASTNASVHRADKAVSVPRSKEISLINSEKSHFLHQFDMENCSKHNDIHEPQLL